MASNIGTLIDYYEREKGLPRQKIIDALNGMFLAAYRKMIPGSEKIRDLEAEIEIKTDNVKILALLTVTPDEEISDPFNEIKLSLAEKIKPGIESGEQIRVNVAPKNFGRIEVQVGRNTLKTRLMEAEKEMLFDEFKDRVGELVIGTVKKFDRNDVIIDLGGKYEGVMPSRERIPGEDYSVGDRLNFYIVEVRTTNRGPEVVLSRSHPNLVKRLFESEVAEIADGTVEIHGIAREAGYRTKIAVASRDKNVDPVGSCVGVRGARVKSIVRELNNEKVDVLRWHDDPAEFVKEALKPIIPFSISVDDEKKTLNVLVENDEDLSKAIGRRGQNARLTARLMGWDVQIRIKPDQSVIIREQLERAANLLAEKAGISLDIASELVQNGFTDASMLLELDADELMDILGTDSETASQLIQQIQQNCQ